MGKIEENEVICSGCGIKIQTTDKGQIGYTPKSALEREVIICQRCYRLTHYNEVQDISLKDDDFLKVLTTVGDRDALVVKIVDIFDFDGSWLSGLQRYVGNNRILIVGNKVDLLPKSVKRQKVIQWMKKAAKDYGFVPVDIALMSAHTTEGIDEAADLIEKYRNGKDVFVVGCTNVGKSTFINQLLKTFGADDAGMITTSPIPGTTLDMIDIALEDGSSLYDTPGIINHHQMAHLVSKKELAVITPKKEIKPLVYQLKSKQSLFFAGLARLDFIEGSDQSFIVYMANGLTIHRSKLEKADDILKKHHGTMLSPPGKENLADFPEFVNKEWKVESGKYDLVFSGLGWVTISGTGSTIKTMAPKGVQVTLRPSIF